MAITPTTRHSLSKQDLHDASWQTALNATLEYIDDRLNWYYAGNPNGLVVGNFIGQQIYDSTNGKIYICTTAGNAASAVWTDKTTIAAGSVTEAMQVLADNTTNNASTSKHGYLKKLSNVASETMNGDGNWTRTVIPAGTVMLFWQAAAPTGWTQVTTQNNKALRVVSATGGGTGGSVAFTTAFASQNVGATALSVAQMPAHQHISPGTENSAGSGPYGSPGSSSTSHFEGSSAAEGSEPALYTSSVGGGSTHTHTLDIAVQYIDVIIASKDAY